MTWLSCIGSLFTLYSMTVLSSWLIVCSFLKLPLYVQLQSLVSTCNYIHVFRFGICVLISLFVSSLGRNRVNPANDAVFISMLDGPLCVYKCVTRRINSVNSLSWNKLLCIHKTICYLCEVVQLLLGCLLLLGLGRLAKLLLFRCLAALSLYLDVDPELFQLGKQLFSRKCNFS